MKKVIFLLVMIGGMGVGGYGQVGGWTWMNGDSTANSLGHYGTQGVFDSLNTPPALYEACQWTDDNGNFWLFGGYNDTLAYSDLWEFKPDINQWAWIKGTGMGYQYGIYGIKYIPSVNNLPGERGRGIMTWVDSVGNLWMYGGGGNGATNYGLLNDLWMYNISTNEWTWMNGSENPNLNPVYGIQGVPDTANNPGGRAESNATWYENNNLWLFGGQVGLDMLNDKCNDLWKYDISTEEWTWIKGPNIVNQPGIYGIKGVQDTANMPRASFRYSSWKSSKGDFWIFGGVGFASILNDMWRYNIDSNCWTWMSGSNGVNDPGVYASQCTTDSTNLPGARFENRACWSNCDNFIIYGGTTPPFFSVRGDLWDYNVNTNHWTWMNGPSSLNDTGNFGTKMVSSPTNLPPNRSGCIGWKDNYGNLWLFGGYNGSGNY